MKTLSLWLILWLLSGIAVLAQVKATVRYDYLLYLPKNYSTQTNLFPLVIYLHGASQRGTNLDQLKAYGLPHLVDQGTNFDFIIASPQCPAGKYWSTENWFSTLDAELVTHYRIDTNRIYLTGISMGGYGVYITALDFPNTFAALLPLCGGCNDSDTNRLCRLDKIPIWAFHGTSDTVVPIAETQRIYDALQRCGGRMIFTRLENEGHGLQYLYEKKPEMYQWLLRQRKP